MKGLSQITELLTHMLQVKNGPLASKLIFVGIIDEDNSRIIISEASGKKFIATLFTLGAKFTFINF